MAKQAAHYSDLRFAECYWNIHGQIIKELNVIIPDLYFIACLIFTIALWICYPSRRNVKPGVTSSALYIRRKLFDFFLGAVTFLMIIYAGNNWKHLFIKSESAQASNIIYHSKDSAIYNNPLIKNFIAITENFYDSSLEYSILPDEMQNQVRPSSALYTRRKLFDFGTGRYY